MNSGGDRLLRLAESGRIPDALLRFVVRFLLRRRLAAAAADDVQAAGDDLNQFVAAMREAAIAPMPERANEQHYEVPAAFFEIVLGLHRKYSCCYWRDHDASLSRAEHNALELTAKHAQLEDGQQILELGCGWGSLSLWMAAQYPNAHITAVSNSVSQRDYIVARAAERRLANLTVLTCDMNDFEAPSTYDRIVSVEMFEHMRNYEMLFANIRRWLNPDGRFFMHIFCHRLVAYVFEDNGPQDWMGRHFFSGGIMPSLDLPARFQRDLTLLQQWRWDGRHYEKTANAWLDNMDANRSALLPILAQTYGEDAALLWFQRWRLFFIACAELFGFRRGQEWLVGHYLFAPEVTPS